MSFVPAGNGKRGAKRYRETGAVPTRRSGNFASLLLESFKPISMKHIVAQ
jgi:hypothetical protein